MGASTAGRLADLVVALHLLFILFTVFGGLLTLRWRWAPWIHLPATAWGAFVELTGRVCPLTPLENRLRIAAGESTYQGDFIGRYVTAVVYPEGLGPTAQVALGVLLLVVNVVVYAVVWRRVLRPPSPRDR